MSKKTYLIFAILFSALSIIYPAIVLIQHPHGYVICTYIYTALTVSNGTLCWLGHAFKSNPQRTNKEHLEKCLDEIDRLKTANAEQKTEIEQLTEERETANKHDLMYWFNAYRECAEDCEKYVIEASDTKAENIRLQKQVDELKSENTELYKEHTALIAGSILKQREIAKDTAKEILEELDLFFKGTTFRKGYEFKKIDQKLKEMRKNYNVEN